MLTTKKRRIFSTKSTNSSSNNKKNSSPFFKELMHAIREQNIGNINNLLKTNKDYIIHCIINNKDDNGETPLIAAINTENIEIILTILMVPGINLNFKDNLSEEYPIVNAITKNLIITAMLLGKDPNIIDASNKAKDSKGRTPLIAAVETRNPYMVWLLFFVAEKNNFKINIDGLNENYEIINYETALMIAVKNGDMSIVDMILSRKNKNKPVDEKAAQLAKEKGYEKIAKKISNYIEKNTFSLEKNTEEIIQSTKNLFIDIEKEMHSEQPSADKFIQLLQSHDVLYDENIQSGSYSTADSGIMDMNDEPSSLEPEIPMDTSEQPQQLHVLRVALAAAMLVNEQGLYSTSELSGDDSSPTQQLTPEYPPMPYAYSFS